MNKRGVLEQLSNLIIPLLGAGIALAMAFMIFTEAKSQIQSVEGLNSTGGSTANPDGSVSWNSTVEVINAYQTIPEWFPIIILAMIAVIMIGIVSLFKG